MRRAVAIALVLAAFGVAACQSTQDKAKVIQKQGEKALAGRKGLEITEVNKDVKVLGKTLLHDANGTAVVVELENTGAEDEAAVPIAIQLADAKGKKLFANDAPGLEPALVSAPLLRRDKAEFWVHNQIVTAVEPKTVDVTIGVPKDKAVPAEPPHITLSNVKLDKDDSGPFVHGVVHNRSDVEQKRLTIFCVSRKGGKVIAAGRAVVEKLPVGEPKKPITFSVYFIGDPAGGTLDFSVPPVALR